MPKTVKDFTKPTLKLFWEHTKRYPHLFWPVVVLVPVMIIATDFLMPYITAQILDHLSKGSFNQSNVWETFGPMLAVYAVAAIAAGTFGWRLIIWCTWSLQMYVARDIMQRVFSHLLDMSASFHANRFGGSLVSQANKLTGAYMRLSDPTLFSLMPLIVSLIATAAILLPRAPLYVAVLLAASVLYLIGTIYFSKAVREANAKESSLQSRQTGYLADSITNMSAIKTFAATHSERERFWGVNNDVVQAGRVSMYATLKRQNYASFITQGLLIAALVIAVVGVGVLRADVATVFLVVSFTASLAHRLWEFQNVLRQYNRAFGDSRDMVEILQIEPGIKDPVHPETSQMHQGAIAFSDVTFTHGESDEPLFEHFDLDIKPGQRIGLVGHSGSGKTTLTKLLLRFSDLDSGTIAIDGQDITHVTQDDLRRVISYVPQEPLLFHRSLRENIAYGKPDASDAEIIKAAKHAHAHEFIERLPHGYDTLVGERGVKLSGGQRQRIAIARAMLKDAPILVLDEATSALDSESEKLIQDALWKLMEGRTAIVIAHRLSTIQRMDRIMVLDAGHIAEQGSHAELLAASGTYASLWSHQSGGFIDDDATEDQPKTDAPAPSATTNPA